MFQIFPPELQRLPVAPDPAHGQMDVRVLRIVMSNSDPFEVGTQIDRQASRQVSRQPFQIHPLSEFWRKDHLPKPWIAGGLPAIQFAGDIYSGTITTESHRIAVALRRALASEIAPMCLPLPTRSIVEVCGSDGAPLVV
ncbi:MAG TPA: hypothetical protein VH640_10410 [Bryobacteraceae bacterium]|jgi:hypothetical protein